MKTTLADNHQINVRVSGMDCAGCARTVETALNKLPQVEHVKVSVARELAQIVLNDKDADLTRIEKTIQLLGFDAKTLIKGADKKTTASRVCMTIQGMDCGSCAMTVEKALSGLAGVSEVKVSVSREQATFLHDVTQTPSRDIQDIVKRLGFTVGESSAPRPNLTENDKHACCTGGRDEQKQGLDHRNDPAAAGKVAPNKPISRWRTPKTRHAVLSAVAVALSYAALLVNETVGHYAFMVATLFALYPVAKRAFVAARFGSFFTIHMLMTLAAIGALIIGEQEEAAIVILLFMVGEMLEGVAADRARAGIKALGKLLPQTARVEQDGAEINIPINQLIVGQTVVVRPGDRLPADGIILDGTTSIDESPVTGESIPVHKAIGDDVLAGTVNHDAKLRVHVTKSGADNTIARIIALVEEAQDSKAPIERFIDGFSRIYMPVVLLIAGLVMIVPPLLGFGEWQTWIYRGLALLLIGCPCALVISVPAAIASSLAAGARKGILLKGGAVIEAVAQTSMVVFDKTGTLTRGAPAVTDIATVRGSEADLLAVAYAIEQGSSHPLAQAITEAAKRDGQTGVRADNVRVVPGKGMEGEICGAPTFIGAPRFAAERAEIGAAVGSAIHDLEVDGKSVAIVVQGGAVLGYFAMRDEPRDNAARCVAALSKQGVDALMLTGDNKRTADAIGQTLGIKVQAEMLPEDKAAKVKSMVESTHVMMVGDGVNDAPALAQAHVGVAMGAGTDVAMEASDAALMRNDIADVNRMIGLARGTMRNIRQNVAIALGLKAVFLVTTITGTTGLWMAIMADTGATVLVTLNAMRLLMYFKGEDV